jgi:hypothetical protein
MTESDFANVTSDGRMCDDDGQLAFPQFEAVMRKQVPLRDSARWLPTSHAFPTPCTKVYVSILNPVQGRHAQVEDIVWQSLRRAVSPGSH